MRSNSVPEPIAIVGIGCAFPGARGPEAFWQLLREGRSPIQEIPPERFAVDHYHDPTPGALGKIIARRGGFLENIDCFDPGFFGISAREAESMDPQQRLLLEVAWEAVEDAGLTRTNLRNSNTGVFIGVSSSDYSDMQLQRHDSSTMDVYTLPGTARSIVAGRISHLFDLNGPSIAVDTACSSSLVAAHLACQSLWRGECNLALVGGVNVMLTPEAWAVLSLARIISPDGYAKVFDARANGFVRGEGAGIVVLKPLAQAQADGDLIYAGIRGSAINNDGHNSSVMTPNQQAQEAVLRAAYRQAGIKPGQVHYVEAHGTGTSVGDPIEARALGVVMAEGRVPDSPCLIGSVKTNIGHLEAGAGIAGLIKVALCLKHRAIPPSLHFETPNPAVSWGELPLVVQQSYREWPVSEGMALAGVSSFGISGTNVHMVLSDAPATLASELQPDANGAYLLPLSAHTPDALAETAARFRDFLDREENGHSLHDLCYSASVRRTHHAQRLAFVVRSRQELAEQLNAYCHGTPAVPTRVVSYDGYCGPVFVFSGQGAKFWPVDPNLLTRFPRFQAMLLCCEDLLHAQGADWSLLEQLTGKSGTFRLHETDASQAAIFACQVALATQWQAWGIEPSAVIGHSLGEVAAAHVAGAISLEQAIRIVFQRGRITKQAAGKGAMALVGLSTTAATEAIHGYESALAVAVSNSPTASVLSGDPTTLAEVLAKLEQQNILVRRLPAIDYAAHSPQMEPLKHELALALTGLAPQRTAIPFYSTVRATAIDGTKLHAHYWADNLREPVRFSQTVQQALSDGHRCLLEVHPIQVLLRPMQEVVEHVDAASAVYSSLHRNGDGPTALLRALGNLYRHGYPVRWDSLYPTGGYYVTLPSTAWQKRRYWLFSTQRLANHASQAIVAHKGTHPLIGMPIQSAAQPDAYLVQVELGRTYPAYLADHRVYDAAILPAAAYIEMALAVAHAIKRTEQYILTDLAFEKALILPGNGIVPIQIAAIVTKETISLEYYSCSDKDDGAPWVYHAKATIRLKDGESDQPLTQGPSPTVFQCEAEAMISGTNHYQMMTAHGLNYGPCFQGIGQLWRHETTVLAKLDLPKIVTAEMPKYHLHPALLDLAFQSVAAILHPEERQQTAGAFLPVALKSLRICDAPFQATYTHAVLYPPQDGAHQRVTADVCLLDDEGQILVEAQGLVLQQVATAQSHAAAELEQSLYQVAWQKQPLSSEGESAAPDRWLIIGKIEDGLGDALAKQLQLANQECLLIPSRHTQDDQIDLMCHESVCQLIATLIQADKSPKGIFYLAPLDTTGQEEVGVPVGQPALIGLLHLVQALAQHSEATPPRLWLVTRGAYPVMEADKIFPSQTPLWGLARTISLELPKFRCSSIDLAAQPEPGEVAHLCREVLADGVETQIAFRSDKRWVARLARYIQGSVNRQRLPAPGEAFRLEMSAPGILDHLCLTATERAELAPEEVEIRVHSAGLNFLDVLSALGLRPDQTDAELILGMECAGTVTQVGKNVTNIHVGDDVLAVAPHSISNYTRTLARLITPKPAHLSFQEAATVPIAYLTAYYALHTLGRLQAGERILIHAAAGGVGLAAVYLAQWLGVEIYATAGTPEKRAFLRELGIAYVMDSRSLDFVDEVMAYTNGEGVDLVLNSLAGEAIPKSLSVLRANGRFLEIGKRDIYGRSRLDMGLLKKNIAFFAIDLIPLMVDQTAFCAELLADLSKLLTDGALPPLPYLEFPIVKAEEAFRYMAQAKHIGKIVIRADAATDDSPLQITPPPHATIRRDGAYLITGGLGGLGLCVAQWLVAKGARNLVLLSRGKPSPEAQKMLTTLEAQGATIVPVQADVTCAAEVAAVLKQIASTMPPLRGLFHAAGSLDDGMLQQMSEARFQRVMAPKVDGAWLLHQMTSHLDLDLFVLFSSATAILGSPGQGNYAAANAFLDGLACYRYQQGLPALSINWGSWAEVGMAAQMNRAEHLARMGILPFAPAQGVQMLERVLATSAVQVTAMKVDWSRLHQHISVPFLEDLAADYKVDPAKRIAQSTTGVRQQLQSLAPAERRHAVVTLLQKQLAQVLRTPTDNLGVHQPLSALGIDSLMTVELVNRIEADLGLTLPMSTLLQNPTITNLAELVVGLVESTTDAVSEQRHSYSPEDVAPDEHFALPVVELAGEAVLDPALSFTGAPALVQATSNNLFLTGATGFVGTFLLRDLLLKSEAQITCLVRATDPVNGRQRLSEALQRTFPGEHFTLERVIVVAGDLAQPHLGLSQSTFDRLAEEIDLIIHSGAQIKWLAPYSHLKPVNVLGTQSILQLAGHCRLKPLHYVSSLAVFPIIEHGASPLFDEQTPLEHAGLLYGGYAQSKWVAEKLVAIAQERGLPVAIYRPSLVAGHSQTGVWQGNNVIVNMLRSWIELGMAPDLDARLDLATVDYISQAIVQLALGNRGRTSGIYHLNNERTVSVRELIDWLAQCGYTVHRTPYHVWRDKMLKRGDIRRQTVLDAVGPLLALQVSADVTWLERLPRFSNQHTQHVLECLPCPPVDVSVFQAYMEYLQQIGSLPLPL